jgi:polar amino acid transport system substrate-binding protein
MDMLASGAVAAFALTHDALPTLQHKLPGSRILAGAFQVTGVALALQKNQAAALAFASAFIQSAKKDGTVRRALDNAGLGHLAIAD